MKAKFTKQCEIEIVDHYDEDIDDVISSIEMFNEGEEIEFDVFGHPERVIDGNIVEDTSLLNIQFGDGSVAFGVSKEWMEIEPEKNEKP